MHWTRFAPELSATSRMVRIWIMGSLRDELLDEADDDEALVARDRAVLLDLDLVADLEFVLLVVRLEARTRPHVFAVERITPCADDLDGHRLVHLVADDFADHLASVAMDGARGGGGSLGRFAHLLAS